jgi:hypothetical protein
MLGHCCGDLLPFSHKSISEGIVMLKPNCCHEVGSTELSRMSLNVVVLRFPFTGTKGPEPWQIDPDHNFSSTKLYSCHCAFRQVAFSRHPPNTDVSIGLPDGEAWFITQDNAFPLSQSPMAASFTPLQPTLGIAHGDLRLVCDCSATETHFMKFLCWRWFQWQFGTR